MHSVSLSSTTATQHSAAIMASCHRWHDWHGSWEQNGSATKLMPATHAQQTCTRNLCKSSCTRNLHVCRSISYKFLWYKFHACNRTQLYSSTETVRHMTWAVQRDWPESCFGARNCNELVSNFSRKFLVQVSWACVAGISRDITTRLESAEMMMWDVAELCRWCHVSSHSNSQYCLRRVLRFFAWSPAAPATTDVSLRWFCIFGDSLRLDAVDDGFRRFGSAVSATHDWYISATGTTTQRPLKNTR